MPNWKRKELSLRATCQIIGKFILCVISLMLNCPVYRRPNIYFNISSPTPGTFIIALHYKGRDKAILEMDLKIDDLLEKQKDNKHLLDLEYVQLNVPKVLGLLNKVFSKRK